MSKMVLTVCVAVLLAVPAVRAGENDPGLASIEFDYQFTDTGWSTGTATSDCDDGWGDDTWELTLTYGRELTIHVLDCCIIGDYYEVWVDGALVDTTPAPGYPGGTTHSEGWFTVALAPGVHLIEIRNALFETLGPVDLAIMCPAGVLVEGSLGAVIVDVDIKPGSCPNPFNGKSKGSVPVGIAGTADLDVTMIDPASITLMGVPALAEFEIKDSTQPGDYDPDDCYDCFEGEPVDTDGDGIPDYVDGYLDLVVKFDTQELAAAIGPQARDACIVLELQGAMIDGTPIIGSDSVVIRTK